MRATIGTIFLMLGLLGACSGPTSSVVCGGASCTTDRRGAQGTCAAGERCVVGSACTADAGPCDGFCFDFGDSSGRTINTQATCDAAGCCSFTCGSIAGDSCPSGLECELSSSGSDPVGACVK